ncbi:MAG: DUF892 family protein [Verrucomicrobiota bacterium JB022]|nr:DUF892 family protein [Verrucomicrobiota bacterium JB022]
MSDTSQQRSVGLRDLYLDQLRDLYSVECQLIPAFEELAKLASCNNLQRLFERHVEETRLQQERLAAVGHAQGWDLGGDPSKAMEGLIKGGHAHIKDMPTPEARDVLIVAHTRRVKQYELAAYGIVEALAKRIGCRQDIERLRASADEEHAMDLALARLAEDDILDALPAD